MNFWMIKVAKCGSSSFCRMFPPQATRMEGRPGLEKTRSHLTLSEVYRKCHRANVEVPFTFAFTRNPWDRAVSGWQYTCGKFPTMSLLHYLRTPNKRSRHIIRPITDYIFHGPKTVDFLGRFENFEADAKKVCEMLGYPDIEILHSNKRADQRNYRGFYNPEARNIVAKRYARDIQHGKYTF